MKTQRITNLNYRRFLDDGIFNIITEADLNKALKNVDKTTRQYRREGKCLLIALYYTGARPNEILRMLSTDIKLQGQYIMLKVPGSKGGLPRTIYLSGKVKYVRYLYEYSKDLPPNYYLFFHYKNNYKRLHKNKKGEIKEYICTTDKLRYYFNRWFEGVIDDSIPPYYLRHNRFSKLSEAGSSAEEIRILKGGKTLSSVTPYLHMSSRALKKQAKKIR